MIKTVLKVGGMSCEHCVKAIRNAVGALPGVESVSVDLDAGTVTLEHDPAQSPLEGIRHEIQEQGYEVEG